MTKSAKKHQASLKKSAADEKKCQNCTLNAVMAALVVSYNNQIEVLSITPNTFLL